MKQVLATALLSLTAVSAQAAIGHGPRPESPIERARLTNFDGVNHFRNNGVNSLNQASIALTYDNHLELTVEVLVPMGPMLPAFSHETRTVKLPIISDETDSCGARIITAERDMRPVDGFLRTIVLKDYRSEICDIHRVYMTEVSYSTTSPGFGSPVITTESVFLGDRMGPVYYPMAVRGAVR